MDSNVEAPDEYWTKLYHEAYIQGKIEMTSCYPDSKFMMILLKLIKVEDPILLAKLNELSSKIGMHVDPNRENIHSNIIVYIVTYNN